MKYLSLCEKSIILHFTFRTFNLLQSRFKGTVSPS
jgi:hypothetical protein